MRLTRAQVQNPAALLVLLNEYLTDITAVRAAVPAITAKLDADAALLLTNYAATADPAALTVIREEPNQPGIGKDPVYT